MPLLDRFARLCGYAPITSGSDAGLLTIQAGIPEGTRHSPLPAFTATRASLVGMGWGLHDAVTGVYSLGLPGRAPIGVVLSMFGLGQMRLVTERLEHHWWIREPDPAFQAWRDVNEPVLAAGAEGFAERVVQINDAIVRADQGGELMAPDGLSLEFERMELTLHPRLSAMALSACPGRAAWLDSDAYRTLARAQSSASKAMLDVVLDWFDRAGAEPDPTTLTVALEGYTPLLWESPQDY